VRRIWFSRWRWGLLGALAAVSVFVVGIVGGIIHDNEDGDGKQGSPTVTAASPAFGLASPRAQSPTATVAALAPTSVAETPTVPPPGPTATPVSPGETPEPTAPPEASPTEPSTAVPLTPTATPTLAPSAPTVTATPGRVVWYSFTPNAPSATWSSSTVPDPIAFGGPDTNDFGFAMWRDNFLLEDGSQPARVLEMHPAWVGSSYINGEFILPGTVGATARFTAKVGFLDGADAGAVTFRVVFFDGEGSPVCDYSVGDSGSDGALRTIDIDLSGCAGANRAVLWVYAGPSSAQDWAVWVDARVER